MYNLFFERSLKILVLILYSQHYQVVGYYGKRTNGINICVMSQLCSNLLHEFQSLQQKFEVLIVVSMRIAVSWNAAPCGVVDTNVEEKCAVFIFSKDKYDRSSQMWVLYN
jgi:hypothetical protein